eukprot:3009772-Karenia_brevis.AAC.1
MIQGVDEGWGGETKVDGGIMGMLVLFENLADGEGSEDEDEYKETVTVSSPSLASSDDEEAPIVVPTELEMMKEM